MRSGASSIKSKRSRPPSRRKDPSGEIQLLRMRVAEAVSIWKEAKQHAAQARRRRKLAKLFAKRAKKDARQAKANLNDIRQALALAEAKAAVRRLRSRRKLNKAKIAKARKEPAKLQRALRHPKTAQRRKLLVPSHEAPQVDGTPPELVEIQNAL